MSSGVGTSIIASTRHGSVMATKTALTEQTKMSQGVEQSCNANQINLHARMESSVSQPLPSVQVIQSVPTTATRLAAQHLLSRVTRQLNSTALAMAKCASRSAKSAMGRTIVGDGKMSLNRVVASMSAQQIMEVVTSYA